VSGTTTNDASDNFHETANMIAIVETTCAVLQIERVTSSVTTALAFVVSVSMREITCPTLFAVNQLIGNRSRCAYSASRRSRTTNSCNWAPIWPLSHTRTFLSVTASNTSTITLRREPI
jgi:hypothetical protein